MAPTIMAGNQKTNVPTATNAMSTMNIGARKNIAMAVNTPSFGVACGCGKTRGAAVTGGGAM